MKDTQFELIEGYLINMAYVEYIGLVAEPSGKDYSIAMEIQFQSGKSIKLLQSLPVDPEQHRTEVKQIDALIEGLHSKYGKQKDS